MAVPQMQLFNLFLQTNVLIQPGMVRWISHYKKKLLLLLLLLTSFKKCDINLLSLLSVWRCT